MKLKTLIIALLAVPTVSRAASAIVANMPDQPVQATPATTASKPATVQTTHSATPASNPSLTNKASTSRADVAVAPTGVPASGAATQGSPKTATTVRPHAASHHATKPTPKRHNEQLDVVGDGNRAGDDRDMGIVTGPTPNVHVSPSYRDPRMVRYPYDPDTVFEIITRGSLLTQLKFSVGERITGLYFSDACVVLEKASQGDQGDSEGGDTAQPACDSGWHVTVPRTRDRVFMKPSANGMDNEATITTNRRTYELSITSTDTRQWFKRVEWTTRDSSVLELGDVQARTATIEARANFEQAPRQNLQADVAGTIPVDKLYFNYRIEGNAAFRPEVVFDDGTFTRFKLPVNLQERPVILALFGKNQAERVDFWDDGPYIRVAGVHSKLLLKLGDDEVVLTRRDR